MNKLQLHELQEKFSSNLNSNNKEILTSIVSTENLSAEQRLGIYKSSIKGALQNVLMEIYPVCKKLVGDDFFIIMISDFIDLHPSYSTDLAGYGQHLAEFIETFDAAKSLPYLADIARLEWALHIIFSAKTSKQINFEALAECYQNYSEQLIFTLPHANTLLSSHFPIHLIWEANQDENDEVATITLPQASIFYYLVWRKEESIMRIDLLTKAEWQILSWMKDRMTLGNIYTEITAKLPGTKIEDVLPKFVIQGWLTGFEIGDPLCR